MGLAEVAVTGKHLFDQGYKDLDFVFAQKNGKLIHIPKWLQIIVRW